MREKVTTFTLNGEEFSKGDQIKVLPSQPGHRDGFVGRVVSALVEDGKIIHIDVFGAPGSRAALMRSFLPERLSAIPKKKVRKSKKDLEVLHD